MTTVAGFAGALNMVKAMFPTAVLTFRNGSYECDATTSTRDNEPIIDPNTGRVDPDRFRVRVKISECGPINGGLTVMVNDEACLVEDPQKDEIGLTMRLTLRRKRVAP